MIEKNQRRLKKAQQVKQRYFIGRMVVHCETNCNEICRMVEQNSEKALKKSATYVTKVFYMQYGGSL